MIFYCIIFGVVGSHTWNSLIILTKLPFAFDDDTVFGILAELILFLIKFVRALTDAIVELGLVLLFLNRIGRLL